MLNIYNNLRKRLLFMKKEVIDAIEKLKQNAYVMSKFSINVSSVLDDYSNSLSNKPKYYMTKLVRSNNESNKIKVGSIISNHCKSIVDNINSDLVLDNLDDLIFPDLLKHVTRQLNIIIKNFQIVKKYIFTSNISSLYNNLIKIGKHIYIYTICNNYFDLFDKETSLNYLYLADDVLVQNQYTISMDGGKLSGFIDAIDVVVLKAKAPYYKKMIKYPNSSDIFDNVSKCVHLGNIDFYLQNYKEAAWAWKKQLN